MLRAGMILGDRYEILSQIGSGGMADVYKAKCHKLNRNVAIKVLKEQYSSDRNFLARFRAEAQAAAKLSHPNIVNIYDVGDEGKLHYIVMELIEGITLKEYITRKGKLENTEVIGIAVQVAQGLTAAHAQNIIHRDIKPQNIIISRDGKVKVMDFGIARITNGDTIASNALGSVHYISPEQARGAHCDQRSDIYSLGITMYEMTTGMVPFDGDNPVSVALAHIQNAPKAPRELSDTVSRSLNDIILKCIMKKPDLRYDSVMTLIADLRKSHVMPNGTFVVMTTAAAGGETMVFSAQDTEKIRQLSVIPAKGELIREELDEEDLDEDFYDEDSYEEDFDEDDFDEEYDPENVEKEDEDAIVLTKLDRALDIAAIVLGVLILVLSIYLGARVFGVIKSGGNSQHETETTTEEETLEEGHVYMPDLLDMTEEEAIKLLDKLGLEYEITREYSETVKKGCVSYQNFEENEVIDTKTEMVEFTVSKGSSMVEIPSNILGMSASSARIALEALGFTVVEAPIFSDTVDIGLIARYYPNSAKAPAGSEITIYISQGEEPEETIPMPDVTNMAKEDAVKLLNDLGITDIQFVEQSNDEVEEGYIYSQSIQKDTKVVKTVTVVLYVSTGAEGIEMPDVTTEMNADQSLAILEELGLKYRVETKYSNSVEAGWVISQNIPFKQIVSEDTEIIITVSLGREPKETESESETESKPVETPGTNTPSDPAEPGTSAPETSAPETSAPETSAPETSAPAESSSEVPSSSATAQQAEAANSAAANEAADA